MKSAKSTIKSNEHFQAVMKLIFNRYLMEAKDSIARSKHMNKLKGVQPKPKKVKTMVEKFLAYCKKNHQSWTDEMWQKEKIKVKDVLTMLTDQATAMKKAGQLSGKAKKAIVVDFINFVGRWFSCDYGLYTRDLK